MPIEVRHWIWYDCDEESLVENALRPTLVIMSQQQIVAQPKYQWPKRDHKLPNSFPGASISESVKNCQGVY